MGKPVIIGERDLDFPVPLLRVRLVLLLTVIGASFPGFARAADLPVQAPEPLPPEEAAARMRVPEGFEVNLFAGEPDVKQPVSLCLDDRGRLWVAEAYSYPDHTDEPAKDRILIFEDEDGDGRFDRRTVFYDRLNYVSGIEVGFGGVWVMSPPYFFFIPDRDGDDVPDGEPEVVLDGFGNHSNAHNIANGFAWGPDGWLYGTHGRTNWSLIGKPGTPEAERIRFDGGVWRFHPVRGVWEPFADGCTNPWGIDWDDYGQAFIPNTVDPHLFHAIQGAHYEPWRNRESSRFAYERIETIADHLHFIGGKDIRAGLGSAEEMALGGGHSHCGILVYLGDNWPDRFRNTVFLHNTHGRRINHDILARKGSGYTASHAPDLVQAEDPWFMGVNFRTAPDGTVYFTDWSDTGECHSIRNTRRKTGRIYRIAYGTPEKRRVDLAELDDGELVDLQLHKNDWFVRHARRLLHERAAAGRDLSLAHAQLRELFVDDHPDETRKLRALWSLWVTGGIDDEFLVAQLDHPSEYVRAWAVQFLCEDRSPPREARDRFTEMAREGDSQLVRLYLASALQRLRADWRWPIAEGLIGRSEDIQDQNLPLMGWYGIEPLVHADVVRFAGLVEDASAPLTRRHIARRIASLPDPAPGLEALFAHLAERPDPAMVEGLLAGFEGRSELPMPANWPDTVAVLWEEPALRLAALEIGALFGDASSLDRLRELAEDESAPRGDRIHAVEQLLRSRPRDVVDSLLGLIDSPAVQRVVLRGLSGFDHRAIPTVVLSRYDRFPDLETKRDALQTLASRTLWAEMLLDAVESGAIPRGDLTAYTSRQIQSLGDQKLTDRVNRLWGRVATTSEEKRKRIDYHVHDLSDELDQADLPEGRLLYQKLCAACHVLFGEGGNLGPDLTGAQRSSVEYLVENIIAPSASVARDYQMQVVELEDGRTVTGFFSAETETTLTIRTLNEEIVTPKDRIAKQETLPVSIMPEGLFDQLTETEIRHLIGYLMNPRQVPLPEEATEESPIDE